MYTSFNLSYVAIPSFLSTHSNSFVICTAQAFIITTTIIIIIIIMMMMMIIIIILVTHLYVGIHNDALHQTMFLGCTVLHLFCIFSLCYMQCYFVPEICFGLLC